MSPESHPAADVPLPDRVRLVELGALQALHDVVDPGVHVVHQDVQPGDHAVCTCTYKFDYSTDVDCSPHILPSTVLPLDPVEERLDPAVVIVVQADPDPLAPSLADLCHHLVQLLLGPAGDVDGGAGLAQLDGDATPDPLGGPGHQADFPLQIRRHVGLSAVSSVLKLPGTSATVSSAYLSPSLRSELERIQ